MQRSLYFKLTISLFIIFQIASAYALQLGDGTNTNQTKFVHIASCVKKVSCGNFHTLFIKENNSLWAMGANNYNQICDSSTNEFLLPVHIMDNVFDISAGSNFSMVLSENHELFIYGSFGKVESHEFSASLLIPIDTEVDTIEAGSTNAFYIKNGDAYGLGTSYDGIFGFSITQFEPIVLMKNVKKIKTTDNGVLFLTENNQLYCLGKFALSEKGWKKYRTPELIASNVIDMTDGLYIDSNKNLYAFGYTGYGALGVDDDNLFISPTFIKSNVFSVSGKRDHSLIIDEENRLYTSGGDYPGIPSALGTGRESSSYQFQYVKDNVRYIETGLYYSMYIDTDNNLYGCGANNRNNGGL